MHEMVILYEDLCDTVFDEFGQMQVKPVQSKCTPRAIYFRNVAEIAIHITADGGKYLSPCAGLAYPCT